MSSTDPIEKVIDEICQKFLESKDLIQRALPEGITIKQREDSHCYSTYFGRYRIEGRFLEALNRAGFKLYPRTDGITTLVDENPQSPTPGFRPSNYWNFKTTGEKTDELLFDIGLIAFLRQKARGIVLIPHVSSPFLSPADTLPQYRVFVVISGFDPQAHPIIHQIAINKGEKIVSWTDIGLGGIRSIQELFLEFTSGNKELERLARSCVSPFDPDPFPRTSVSDKYLPEPHQQALFELWNKQLERFKQKI